MIRKSARACGVCQESIRDPVCHFQYRLPFHHRASSVETRHELDERGLLWLPIGQPPPDQPSIKKLCLGVEGVPLSTHELGIIRERLGDMHSGEKTEE